MRMPNFALGLMLPCLLLLSACGSAPNYVAPPPIVLGCPAVTACTLPPSQPQTNGQQQSEIDVTETAWHACAAQVDMILACQEKQRAAP